MATWAITGLLVKPQADGYTDVVYIVNWIVSDTDGTNEARRGGKTEVPAPAGGTFVPFDQLTEAEVVGWVQATLGPEEVAAIEADLNFQILYMQQPPVVEMPLPWA
jgi:hypothetical protein